MKIYIFENNHISDLNPLSLTRPSFDLRTGPFTFLERTLQMIDVTEVGLIVRPELEALCRERYSEFLVNPLEVEAAVWLLGNVLWRAEEIQTIVQGSSAVYRMADTVVGAKLSMDEGKKWLERGGPLKGSIPAEIPSVAMTPYICRYLWNILESMPGLIQHDSKNFQLGVIPDRLPDVHFINQDKLFIGKESAVSPGAVLDATRGPIIIEDKVRIEPLTFLEGPVYIGSDSIIKPFAHISNCAIGPGCKIGGEVANVIVQGFSNKVHYGYLGDSFLGEWINLGAGTTSSNLKNNYTPVTVQAGESTVNTNLLHVGCFIGDHVKTAIGTVLNTGAVLGPGCMVVTPGFPPKTLRPFTWFVNGKHHVFRWEKFMEMTNIVIERRGKSFSPNEKKVLQDIFIKR
ncbi:MAG: putative sugar nucleotidyl transferase [Fidelibacterota bacterium]